MILRSYLGQGQFVMDHFNVREQIREDVMHMALLTKLSMASCQYRVAVVNTFFLNCLHLIIFLISCISELEINIKFPTCWDGQNVESADGSHVAYATDCDGDEHNECFDFACPASHPVKMPEIHLYVRVLGYEGGAHVFSDGSDVSI